MSTNIRMPVRAGSFYEGSASSCRNHASKLIDGVQLPDDLPAALYGGIVPHAGWMFSGSLAAKTLAALHHCRPLETVVLLGADHVGAVRVGEVYPSGVWRTPLGEVPVDEELAGRLLADAELFRANPDAHAAEHSLEVQVPLLQILSEQVRIVPVAVPAEERAVAIGRAVGDAIAAAAGAAAVVGSTDLTHHGGHFGHPGGSGEEGLRWSEANDRRMLELIEALDADAIVPEARQRHNACGAGAIAATIAACRVLGATEARVLEYTNSYRIVREMYGRSRDDTTVGYASVVFA